ncbi:MAG: RNA-binding S4 domain-containing protein [Eubacterium sp.]|nr:RNA-binding S4 domain-containing protein [Eubacterium sp.]
MKYKLKLAERQKEIIKINTEFIKLDSLLKFSGLAESGSFAKMMIEENNIRVNGERCTARGKKIRHGDIVSVKNIDLEVINED